MILVLENQNLEDVLLDIESRPNLFVVANTRRDKTFDSAAVYLFDEMGILHMVTGVTKTPHVYEFSVPVSNKKGELTGILTRDLEVGTGNCLIKDGKKSEEHFYAKEGFTAVGKLLLAHREFFSEEVTDVLKKIIERPPISYDFKKSRNPVEALAGLKSPDYFGIKSVLKGKTEEFTYYLNVFPIAAALAGVRLAPEQSNIDAYCLALGISTIGTAGFFFQFPEINYAALCCGVFSGAALTASLLRSYIALKTGLDGRRHRRFKICTEFFELKEVENREICYQAIVDARKKSIALGEDPEGPEAKKREEAFRHEYLGINQDFDTNVSL